MIFSSRFIMRFCSCRFCICRMFCWFSTRRISRYVFFMARFSLRCFFSMVFSSRSFFFWKWLFCILRFFTGRSFDLEV